MARIKVRLNGPYLLESDDVTIVDWNGNEYEIGRRPAALCRCGGSRFAQELLDRQEALCVRHLQEPEFQMKALFLAIPEFGVGAQHDL